MKTQTGLVLLGLVTALGLLMAGQACDGDGSGGSGGAGTGGSTTTTTTTTSTMGPGGAGGAGGSGGSGGASAGYCARSCTTPADCCLEGQGNCPSNQYPTNYTCDNGLCGPPRCAVKDDCTASGQLPDFDCLVINGNTACAEPCTSDADCAAPATCTGMADDGTMLCNVDIPPFMCEPGTSCNGFGVCNADGDGCECTDSSQCDNEYVNFCVQ